MVNLMLPTTTQTVTSMVTTTTKTACPASAASTPAPFRKSVSALLSRSAERHPSVCTQQQPDDERSPDVHNDDQALDDEDIDDPDFVATLQNQRSGSNFSRRFSADADFADMVTPTTRSTATGPLFLLQQQQQQQSHPHLQHIGRRSMSTITWPLVETNASMLYRSQSG